MPLETIPWDVADHLDGDEMAVAYLEAAFDDGDSAFITAAINDVARARGVEGTSLQQTADIAAIVRAIRALGLGLTAKAA